MATKHQKPGGIIGKTGSFLLTFAMLFVLVYGFLAVVDALPDAVSGTDSNATGSSQTVATNGTPELPVRVAAPSIGLNVTVVNPTSTDVDVLDDALTNGAVRYPTSAQLGVNGTVLIFGHSSYLPVVYHQYYKTFDGVQNLAVGATVSVYSGTLEYRYKVTGVRVANADEDVVELSTTGKHLVLVTCDSFASKSNRFVVTADFVGTYSLASK